MLIAIPIFQGLTALDAVGPYEVLSRIPGASVQFVATAPAVMRTDRGSLGLLADVDLQECSAPEVVLVPGGPGQSMASQDPKLLDWLRAVDRTTTWTTSVCTGSLILGAAGLLRGRRATTHWLSVERLAECGAIWEDNRVVVDGKYMTAAGVSAGIDMALTLAAHLTDETVAQAIQLSIEYDPQPPFAAGNVTDAPAEIVALVRGLARRRDQTAADGQS